jgi:hypothetical protein
MMVDDSRLPDGTQNLFELGIRRRPAPTGEQQERDFRDVAREARVVAQGLSRVQFNWRPTIGQWSIAECLGHLNIMGSQQLVVIDAGIREARTQGWFASGPFTPGFLARRFIRASEPPVRRRRRADALFVPASDQSADIVVPAIVDLQEQLLGRVRLSNGLDLARIRVDAPGRGLLRLNLMELLLFLAAHERRHLAQAWQVRRDPRFPSVARPRTARLRT